jgi:hypothetical protein
VRYCSGKAVDAPSKRGEALQHIHKHTDSLLQVILADAVRANRIIRSAADEWCG